MRSRLFTVLATLFITLSSLSGDRVSASVNCWYEPGDPPIEHCCGEPQRIGSYYFSYLMANPDLTFSELLDAGNNFDDDCQNFTRIADTVTINCFGSGSNCSMLNLWNTGWRPIGYVESTTLVFIYP